MSCHPPLMNDLILTANCLYSSINGYEPPALEATLLKAVCNAYSKYYPDQQAFHSQPNFHGPRDFYKLVEYVSRKLPNCNTRDHDGRRHILERGIRRNFGGLPEATEAIIDIFLKYVTWS